MTQSSLFLKEWIYQFLNIILLILQTLLDFIIRSIYKYSNSQNNGKTFKVF